MTSDKSDRVCRDRPERQIVDAADQPLRIAAVGDDAARVEHDGEHVARKVIDVSGGECYRLDKTVLYLQLRTDIPSFDTFWTIFLYSLILGN